MKRCAIFAGGDMPKGHPFDSEPFYDDFDFFICADSGFSHAERLGIKPDIIVGDFDSYGGELPEDSEIIRTVPEKDDTDTLMAVKKAIELGYTEISLFGALGGKRFEHSIANIQTMLYARENGCKLSILGESAIYLNGAEDGVVKYADSWNGVYMSVFAMTESADIEYLRGVKYPLENYTMKQSFPIGVSNEITDGIAELKIRSGLLLVILTEM
jgi:thiamine pyrophosphokinase